MSEHIKSNECHKAFHFRPYATSTGMCERILHLHISTASRSRSGGVLLWFPLVFSPTRAAGSGQRAASNGHMADLTSPRHVSSPRINQRSYPAFYILAGDSTHLHYGEGKYTLNFNLPILWRCELDYLGRDISRRFKCR